MDKKGIELQVIQPAVNMEVEHNDRTQSTANKAINKRDHHKQMQKKENFIVMRLGQITRKPDRLCYF